MTDPEREDRYATHRREIHGKLAEIKARHMEAMEAEMKPYFDMLARMPQPLFILPTSPEILVEMVGALPHPPAPDLRKP